jgi:hypothetical protein
MPTVGLELDHSGRPGVQLYLGVSYAERETLGAPRTSLQVLALLDTGASRTVVERRYLEGLGLEAAGWTWLRSATTGASPVKTQVYAVSLALAGERTGVLATDLEVIAAEDLGGLGFRALLGRDVLDHCLLHYDGPARRFALTFEPFEHP